MKIRISDMMEDIECMPLDLQNPQTIDTARLKKSVFQKIETKRPFGLMKKFSRLGAVAAALILCATTALAAVAVLKWNGFAYTDGLSRSQKQALMQEARTLSIMQEDPDGTVHYLDQDGNELMVLSADEAAAYEAEKLADWERAVLESTTRIDASTVELLPQSITEMTVKDGQFADFMLGNGHMVLLCPQEGDGYPLKSGEKITIALDADDECCLGFYLFLDGICQQMEYIQTKQHRCTFSIPEDGQYLVSIMHFSGGANSFTNGSITIS